MKLRPFELALIVIFGILMVLALILLRTVDPEEDKNVVTFGGPVKIWGTLPADVFTSLIYELSLTNINYQSVSYSYIPEKDFDVRFVNALADGNGPDLLFLHQEFLVQNRSRLEVIPYTSFALRDFKTTYVDGAEIFALEDGIYGYPVAVDPLMLFWNRDLFSAVNLLNPPATWEEVVGEVVPALSIRDFNRNLSQSAIAFGEYENVKNAVPIISMLLLQGGSSLVTERNMTYTVSLNDSVSANKAGPFTEVMTFYVNFNNAYNTLYSWNKTQTLDRESFLNEKLAMYFGFGSEAKLLETRNPNLNFDIAPVPQGATVTASTKRTYARFYSFMVPKSALNKTGAYTVMLEMANQSNAQKIADNYNFAPAIRANLAVGSNDIYGREIYNSVAQSRGWLSPNLGKTNEAFKKLLNDIASNRSYIYSATNDAIARLQQAY